MATAAATRHCETVVAVLVALNLSFLPWAFGGVDAWSQFTSLALALVSFVVVLRSGGWPRVRAFPIFWAGAGLFAYISLQPLNPAFQYRQEGTAWWLVRVDHIEWLPAGMTAPIASNSWRTMVVWGACWLNACALWAGITRRSTVLLILNIVCVNAFFFGLFGILQRAGGLTEIYAHRSVGFTYFFAALIYKHHAAAYFSLLAFTALGLTVHALRTSRRANDRSSPGILFALSTLVSSAAVLLSFSFSGILLFGSALLGVLPVTLVRLFQTPGRPRSWRLPVVVGAISVVLAVAVAGSVGYHDFREKLRLQATGDGRHAVQTRLLAVRCGWAMFQDRWVDGWGAGCFSYGFTKYQKQEPELARWQHLKFRWEHLHNDWLELLIELGLLGVVPIAAMAWFWIRRIVQLQLWQDPLLFPILAGTGVLALHALVDFPVQNPAVVATVCALIPLVVRWGEISELVPDRSGCAKIHRNVTAGPLLLRASKGENRQKPGHS